MSRVDTAWLRMDNDVNLMMIVGVWMLTPAITLGSLRERIGDKLLRYPRFGQKAARGAMGAEWIDDEAFDLKAHVVPAKLHAAPGETQRQALQRLCGELATQPLDPDRPLWQFHLIDDYEGGSAMIVRVHHCIGDGIALISVMMSITDGGGSPPQRPDHEDVHEGGDWLQDAVVKPLAELAIKAIKLSGSGASKALDAVDDPLQRLLGSVGLARTGLKVARDAAALATLADDSPTLLKGRPAGRKVVAWSEPMPLEPVKTVGRALGCTVNDVLLACVAGAMGSYLQGRGDDPAGKSIRAMVPVNLRPLDQAWQLGNRFGLAPLVLPIGIDHPLQRLQAVRQRMAELKESFQPLLAFAVLSASGLFIQSVQDAILGLFAKKATAVMTNVPGPAVPLKLCGATLRQNMFWVPASGEIGVGVSILSYGGGVQFGLITDQALCPDPQAMIDRFEPEFEKLLLLTLMLPWPGQPDA
jgi:WS/DGAT/MGAT family acyltransferase